MLVVRLLLHVCTPVVEFKLRAYPLLSMITKGVDQGPILFATRTHALQMCQSRCSRFPIIDPPDFRPQQSVSASC